MPKDFVARWLMFIGRLAMLESGKPESTNNEDRAATRLLLGLLAVGETCLILLTATVVVPDKLELMIQDMTGGVTPRFVWGLLYYGILAPIVFSMATKLVGKYFLTRRSTGRSILVGSVIGFLISAGILQVLHASSRVAFVVLAVWISLIILWLVPDRLLTTVSK